MVSLYSQRWWWWWRRWWCYSFSSLTFMFSSLSLSLLLLRSCNNSVSMRFLSWVLFHFTFCFLLLFIILLLLLLLLLHYIHHKPFSSKSKFRRENVTQQMAWLDSFNTYINMHCAKAIRSIYIYFVFFFVHKYTWIGKGRCNKPYTQRVSGTVTHSLEINKKFSKLQEETTAPSKQETEIITIHANARTREYSNESSRKQQQQQQNSNEEKKTEKNWKTKKKTAISKQWMAGERCSKSRI